MIVIVESIIRSSFFFLPHGDITVNFIDISTSISLINIIRIARMSDLALNTREQV